MKQARTLTLLVALALGAAPLGCRTDAAARARAADAGASAADFPVTVNDDLGRPVVLARAPLRIVSLLPSHTETLFALGVGDRIVARDTFSDRPPEVRGRPAVGGLYDANVEAIVGHKPDLVLASEYGSLVSTLEQAGLVTWGGSPQSYDDVFSSITSLGRLVGRAAEAARLNAEVRARVAVIEGRLASARVTRVKVYYEIDPAPYSVGPRSFVGTLLEKAGGTNVVPADLGDFPKIAPEAIVAADPEVILGVSLEEARARPGWSTLRAVREGHVTKLTDDERDAVVRPGPNVADGLAVLARKLHPEVP